MTVARQPDFMCSCQSQCHLHKQKKPVLIWLNQNRLILSLLLPKDFTNQYKQVLVN